MWTATIFKDLFKVKIQIKMTTMATENCVRYSRCPTSVVHNILVAGDLVRGTHYI